MDHSKRIKYLRKELKHQKELMDCLYDNGEKSKTIGFYKNYEPASIKMGICKDIEAEILILEHAH